MLVYETFAVAVNQQHGITGGHKHARAYRAVFQRLLKHDCTSPGTMHVTHTRAQLLRHRNEVALCRQLRTGAVGKHLMETLQHIGIVRKASGTHDYCLAGSHTYPTRRSVRRQTNDCTRLVGQ